MIVVVTVAILRMLPCSISTYLARTAAVLANVIIPAIITYRNSNHEGCPICQSLQHICVVHKYFPCVVSPPFSSVIMPLGNVDNAKTCFL